MLVWLVYRLRQINSHKKPLSDQPLSFHGQIDAWPRKSTKKLLMNWIELIMKVKEKRGELCTCRSWRGGGRRLGFSTNSYQFTCPCLLLHLDLQIYATKLNDLNTNRMIPTRIEWLLHKSNQFWWTRWRAEQRGGREPSTHLETPRRKAQLIRDLQGIWKGTVEKKYMYTFMSIWSNTWKHTHQRSRAPTSGSTGDHDGEWRPQGPPWFPAAVVPFHVGAGPV
jgi:hypothetical protein